MPQINSQTVLSAYHRAASSQFRKQVDASGEVHNNPDVGRLKGRLVAWVNKHSVAEGRIFKLAIRLAKFVVGGEHKYEETRHFMYEGARTSLRNTGNLLMEAELQKAGLEGEGHFKSNMSNFVFGRIDSALNDNKAIDMVDLHRAIKTTISEKKASLGRVKDAVAHTGKSMEQRVLDTLADMREQYSGDSDATLVCTILAAIPANARWVLESR